MMDSAVVVEDTASEESISLKGLLKDIRKKQKEGAGVWEICKIQNIIHELTITCFLLLILCQLIFSAYCCLSATAFVLPLLTLLGVIFYAWSHGGKAALIYNLMVVFLLTICTFFEGFRQIPVDVAFTGAETSGCSLAVVRTLSFLINVLAFVTIIPLVVNILSDNGRGVSLLTPLVIILIYVGIVEFTVIMIDRNVNTRKLSMCDAQLLTLFGRKVAAMVYEYMGN
ncbi:unnamed protein product [Bursaphelenchus okinawaensis]|uniref:Uncharacterized protein n=1 Tax=Bursaphelenchus okinawaensis TaxID=465554 RepID=A0A811JW99_9BILA|nr:unnamed protein product [Bursaphelenchus okinawaensis]CAG9086004.1 unnamed protein product [Bursaphelenchus okinawaensis]